MPEQNGNNNNTAPQNGKTPPSLIVAFIALIVIAAVLYFVTDMLIISMFASIVIVVFGVFIISFLVNKIKKADKKKLMKIIIICVSILAGIGITLGVINIAIPKMTEDDIKAMIVESIQPQVEEVKATLGVSDLTVEVTLEDLEYEKPTIFTNGKIDCDVNICYVSTEFTELDNEIYTEATSDKYYEIKNPDLSDVEKFKYKVYLTCSTYGVPDFKDSSGDKYSFGYDKIYKNGVKAFGYTYPSSSSSSSSSSGKGSSKCSSCNGSGKRVVKWYSNGDWGEVSYTTYKCTACNGTGRRR